MKGWGVGSCLCRSCLVLSQQRAYIRRTDCRTNLPPQCARDRASYHVAGRARHEVGAQMFSAAKIDLLEIYRALNPYLLLASGYLMRAIQLLIPVRLKEVFLNKRKLSITARVKRLDCICRITDKSNTLVTITQCLVSKKMTMIRFGLISPIMMASWIQLNFNQNNLKNFQFLWQMKPVIKIPLES